MQAGCPVLSARAAPPVVVANRDPRAEQWPHGLATQPDARARPHQSPAAGGARESDPAWSCPRCQRVSTGHPLNHSVAVVAKEQTYLDEPCTLTVCEPKASVTVMLDGVACAEMTS